MKESRADSECVQLTNLTENLHGDCFQYQTLYLRGSASPHRAFGDGDGGRHVDGSAAVTIDTVVIINIIFNMVNCVSSR